MKNKANLNFARFSQVIIVIILLFGGCNKPVNIESSEESIITNPQKSTIVVRSINSANVYDSTMYSYLTNCLDYVNSTQDTSNCANFEEYWKSFETYMSNNPLNLLSMDTSLIDNIVSDSIYSYMNLFCDSTITLENYLNESLSFENRILNSRNFNCDQKNIILYSISSMKQIRYIFITNSLCINQEIFPSDPTDVSQEELLNRCIDAKLEVIFANPVATAIFIAGLPGSFFAIVVECAWCVFVQGQTHFLT
jgi:hypothetical protein